MNFDLSEEQIMLKDSARKLMEREVAPFLASFPKDRPLPPEKIKELLKKLIPLGYLGSIIPVEYGGAGLDYLTYGVLMEELDPNIYGLVMITGGTARSVYFLGNETQKKAFIPPILSGEKIGCSAITEPNVGSNPAFVQTRAVLDGGHYVLNGTKTWITNGAFADIAFTLATTDPSQRKKWAMPFRRG